MCSLFYFKYISIGHFFNEGKHHPDIMNIPDIGLCKGLDISAMIVSLPNLPTTRDPVFYCYLSTILCFMVIIHSLVVFKNMFTIYVA